VGPCPLAFSIGGPHPATTSATSARHRRHCIFHPTRDLSAACRSSEGTPSDMVARPRIRRPPFWGLRASPHTPSLPSERPGAFCLTPQIWLYRQVSSTAQIPVNLHRTTGWIIVGTMLLWPPFIRGFAECAEGPGIQLISGSHSPRRCDQSRKRRGRISPLHPTWFDDMLPDRSVYGSLVAEYHRKYEGDMAHRVDKRCPISQATFSRDVISGQRRGLRADQGSFL
jgi:hypothetical protein